MRPHTWGRVNYKHSAIRRMLTMKRILLTAALLAASGASYAHSCFGMDSVRVRYKYPNHSYESYITPEMERLDMRTAFRMGNQVSRTARNARTQEECRDILLKARAYREVGLRIQRVQDAADLQAEKDAYRASCGRYC